MSYENFCKLCHCCWQKYGFVVIETVRENDTEKDLMTLYTLTWLVVVNTSTTQHFLSSATG